MKHRKPDLEIVVSNTGQVLDFPRIQTELRREIRKAAKERQERERDNPDNDSD